MENIVTLVKVIFFPTLVLNLVPLLIWFERKGAAYIQDRRGPNRARILGVRLGGMIHNLADVIKLITKEEFLPAGANRFYFILAPFLILFVYLLTVAVIPFADRLQFGEWVLSLQIADLNVGILYILAISSLGVYGIMLAGWSSNNKYSFLGGLRASSQMVSYELTLGLSLVSLFIATESVSLSDIIAVQGTEPWNWFFIQQPITFLLFLAASFAETNRTPFDLPEAESELVAGFHLEYSSMKFAMFFMAEYAAIVIASLVIAALFFGGWQVPFLSTQDLMDGAPIYLRLTGIGFSIFSFLAGLLLLLQFRPGKYKDARDYEVLIFGIPALLVGGGLGWYLYFIGIPILPEWGPPVFAAACQFTVYLLKVLFLCFFFVWVRWTLPRFRYDQLMQFGWKGMLPLAFFNIVATGIYVLVTA